jgi:hypothetical protein
MLPGSFAFTASDLTHYVNALGVTPSFFAVGRFFQQWSDV